MRAEDDKTGAGSALRSGLVSSSQADLHPRLEECVRRHLDKRWAQPMHRPSVGAYHRLKKACDLSKRRPFILDSGCGTGTSTQGLAGLFPEHLVIGIDRSCYRLGKSGAQDGFLQHQNYALVRAELSTFWRLMVEDGYTPEVHLLLYPNPWPKPRHLKRRWHGHPAFPSLLSLGGEIVLRCNWEIYALEFARAASFATGHQIGAELFKPENGLSPFEKKYHERGQMLYSVTVPRACTKSFQRSSEIT